MRPESDNHHVLHYRQEWELRPEAKELREDTWLVPHMDRDVHEDIHNDLPAVPMLGVHALRDTAYNYIPVYGDYVRSMENFMFAVEEAIKHPKAHDIERDLGRLTIMAVDLQRPYVKEGVIYGA